MMNYLLVLKIVLFFLSSCTCWAQDLVTDFITAQARSKTIYLEHGGPSHWLGLHFDSRFSKGEMEGLGARVGISGVGSAEFLNEFSSLIFPIEINYVIGANRNAMVCGSGLLPAFTLFSDQQDQRVAFDQEGFAIEGLYFATAYRFQSLDRGVSFQISWTPIYYFSSGFNPYSLAIAIGIGFK